MRDASRLPPEATPSPATGFRRCTNVVALCGKSAYDNKLPTHETTMLVPSTSPQHNGTYKIPVFSGGGDICADIVEHVEDTSKDVRMKLMGR